MQLLDWTERLVDIPENGLSRSRQATDEECNAVAAALAATECSKLGCDYNIVALPGNRYRVSGNIAVQIVQPCVVSLEPVTDELSIELDVEFWPSNQVKSLSEEFDEPDREDPEPIEDSGLPVGRVVFELVSSHLNPYPRAPGVELEQSTSGAAASGTDNPFAALSQLKRDSADE